MIDANESHSARLNETQARQARWGRPVFWVLVASVALSCAVLFLIWLFDAQALTSVEPMSLKLPAEGHSQIITPATPKPPSHRDL